MVNIKGACAYYYCYRCYSYIECVRVALLPLVRRLLPFIEW